jgi:hypothetical protein
LPALFIAACLLLRFRGTLPGEQSVYQCSFLRLEEDRPVFRIIWQSPKEDR